ncbi:MAG: hypothetical protein GY865_08585 [candidate division Zixibacteria bacterium]|nr:hypothetical protein [candidate division Zixibacteria bacterium]
MYRKFAILALFCIILLIGFTPQINSRDILSKTPHSQYSNDEIKSKIQFAREIICPKQIENKDTKSTSYSDWVASQDISRSFSAKPVIINNTIRDGSKLCVIVNSDLYPSIESSITQYVVDLTIEGFTVEVHTLIGGSPQDLRVYLQGLYANGMNGCLLVGDLPVAWYKEAVPI